MRISASAVRADSPIAANRVAASSGRSGVVYRAVGLDRDVRDVVGDHVVELACDGCAVGQEQVLAQRVRMRQGERLVFGDDRARLRRSRPKPSAAATTARTR